jgi:HEAT repeat protein
MTELIAQFGTEDWEDAYERAETLLENAGPDRTDQLLRVVVNGFDHENADVRKWCVALMDHHATTACVDPLIDTLEDPKTAVRRHAVHSIGCQSCKDDPLDIDIIGLLIERADRDASIRVRRAAAHMLGNQSPDQRAEQFLTDLLKNAGDEKLRRNARWALEQHSST